MSPYEKMGTPNSDHFHRHAGYFTIRAWDYCGCQNCKLAYLLIDSLGQDSSQLQHSIEFPGIDR